VGWALLRPPGRDEGLPVTTPTLPSDPRLRGRPAQRPAGDAAGAGCRER